ncbi:hypothetical protein PPACK8108_LOCUS4909 [Phakopsora pachyrhizi]|uniref:Uncharacterized protein n=1 Tax=Phakopsora pachyrhizi TaxID=170000 RepID=A0AAV0APK2_PHAPC|nr:hypothetical protein PPACK8108_LOCUS4909 [Phakopsora pachyrhizi]
MNLIGLKTTGGDFWLWVTINKLLEAGRRLKLRLRQSREDRMGLRLFDSWASQEESQGELSNNELINCWLRQGRQGRLRLRYGWDLLNWLSVKHLIDSWERQARQ